MAVCVIARARAVIGGAIFVARTASSSASFRRSTTLVFVGAADASRSKPPGTDHSNSPAPASLSKVRRLSRAPAGVDVGDAN